MRVRRTGRGRQPKGDLARWWTRLERDSPDLVRHLVRSVEQSLERPTENAAKNRGDRSGSGRDADLRILADGGAGGELFDETLFDDLDLDSERDVENEDSLVDLTIFDELGLDDFPTESSTEADTEAAPEAACPEDETEFSPPPRLDLWLAREESTWRRALGLLHADAARVLPVRSALGLYRGHAGTRHQWRFEAPGRVAPTAEPTSVPLREALLGSRFRDEIALLAVDHSSLPEDVLVLCPPLLRQLDSIALQRFWPLHFRPRRVVWFELGVGRSGARDSRSFLSHHFRHTPVHFAMLDLLQAERHARQADHQSVLYSILKQVPRQWLDDFTPWLHLAP